MHSGPALTSWSVSISFQFYIMLYRAEDWFMVGRHEALI